MKERKRRDYSRTKLFLTHLKAIADLSNVPRLPGSCMEQIYEISDETNA